MTTKHTPTSGGAWRVIDGQLIDESVLPAEPAPAPNRRHRLHRASPLAPILTHHTRELTMAQPNLESFKRRGLALALRASASVPIVPNAADGVLLFNGSSGTEFDKIERPVDRPFLTGQPFAVGARRAFIEGEFELFPPTTPGAATESDAICAPLLLPQV